MRYVNNTYFIITFILGNILCCSCTKEMNNPVVTLPGITVSGTNLFEGTQQNASFSVKVYLNKTSEKPVSFDYTTEGFAASAGTDFLAKTGKIVIPPGSLNSEILIEVVADSIKELDEDFKLVFSNPQNGILNQNEVTCTIRNDDKYVPSSNDGYLSADSYPGYKLVWSDEFNGNTLNAGDWNYDIGGSGWGNNESQYYTGDTKNSYVKNGKLTIEAIKEKYQGKDYTSARLTTKGKKEFKFGRIDVRAKLPKGQGIWPAIWMLGANIDAVKWPLCGEIDIMELLGNNPSKVYATIHHSPQGLQAQGIYNLPTGMTFSDEFHVFSLDWEADKMSILLDDKVFFSTTAAKLNASPYPFNSPFFFILNIAVGGRWPGYPDATTVFPQKMEIDYVRVFQK